MLLLVLLTVSILPSSHSQAPLPTFCHPVISNNSVTLTCRLTDVTHRLHTSSVQQWVESVVSMATEVRVDVECGEGGVVEMPLLLALPSLHHVTIARCTVSGILSHLQPTPTSRDDRRQVRLLHCRLLPDTRSRSQVRRLDYGLFMQHLQVLQLSNVRGDTGDVITLLTSVPRYPNLTDLDLSDNEWLTDESVSAIYSQGSKFMPQLLCLNYSLNAINSRVDVLNYPNLRVLDLSHTASAVIPNLPYNDKFTALTINMSHTLFTTFTSRDPISLYTNKGVVLDLGHNNIVCNCANIVTMLTLQTIRAETSHLAYLDNVTCRHGNSNELIPVLGVRKSDDCDQPTNYTLVITVCVVCGVLVLLFIVCALYSHIFASRVRQHCNSRACNNAGCDVPYDRVKDSKAQYHVLVYFCEPDWPDKVSPFSKWATRCSLHLLSCKINMAPGESETNNICEGVKRSLCTVLFLSHDFQSNTECLFHLLVALDPCYCQRLIIVRTDTSHLSLKQLVPAHIADKLWLIPTLRWHTHGLEELTRLVKQGLRRSPVTMATVIDSDYEKLTVEEQIKAFPLDPSSGPRLANI